MPGLDKMLQWYTQDELTALLVAAVAFVEKKPDATVQDIQTALEVGSDSAAIVLDWLADAHHIPPQPVSEHWIRQGRRFVLNHAYPSLEEMSGRLGLGHKRSQLVMQALVKRKVIRIKEDFSFERVGKIASFADLVQQVNVVSKKYGGRCEPELLIRTMYIDPITALRLAQYGEEFLGLRWKDRPQALH